MKYFIGLLLWSIFVNVSFIIVLGYQGWHDVSFGTLMLAVGSIIVAETCYDLCAKN